MLTVVEWQLEIIDEVGRTILIARSWIVVVNAGASAACRGAELLKLCKDAGRRSECLRCLRERIARRIHDHV